MKHIKPFENYTSEPILYSEIVGYEFDDAVYGGDDEYKAEIPVALKDWDTISNRYLKIINDLGFNFEQQVYRESEKYFYFHNVLKLELIIVKLIDDWFYLEVRNRNEDARGVKFYKCDQFDGLLQCLNNYIQYTSLKESSEYIQANTIYDLPPGVDSIEKISISNQDINFIKSQLNTSGNTDIIYTSIIRNNKSVRKDISYYCLWYDNIYTQVPKENVIYTRSDRMMKIFAYTDEWYQIIIDARGNFQVYWCDQIDSVVKCIKDKIGKSINENNEHVSYYQEISSAEAYLLLPKIDNLYLSDSEMGIIKDLVRGNPNGVYYTYENNFEIMIVNFSKNNMDEIEIYRTDDEWFVTRFVIKDQWGHNNRYYHKCDQFDGLVEFLKDYSGYDGRTKLSRPVDARILGGLEMNESNVVKRLNIQEVVDVFSNKTVDENFNINYITDMCKSLNVKNFEVNHYNIPISLNNSGGIRLFKSFNIKLNLIDVENTSIELSIILTPFEDEYYTIHYDMTRRKKPGNIRYFRRPDTDFIITHGDLYIDGRENILPAISNMIENHKSLSGLYFNYNI